MCGSLKKEAAIKAYKVKLVMPCVATSHSSLFLQGCNRVGSCPELFSSDGFEVSSSSSLFFYRKVPDSDKEK